MAVKEGQSLFLFYLNKTNMMLLLYCKINLANLTGTAGSRIINLKCCIANKHCLVVCLFRILPSFPSNFLHTMHEGDQIYGQNNRARENC